MAGCYSGIPGDSRGAVRRGKQHPCLLGRRHRCVYRGASLIRNSAGLGPYSRTMPRALCVQIPAQVMSALSTGQVVSTDGFMVSRLGVRVEGLGWRVWGTGPASGLDAGADDPRG